VFFILPKIAWWLLAPLNAIVLLAATGLVLLALRRRAGLVLLCAATLALIAFAVLPLGGLLLRPLEAAWPRPAELPARVDGILMLGGAEHPARTAAYGFSNLGEDAERYTSFLTLARRYPAAKLAFSGGSGALFMGAPITEAEVTRRFLVEQGIPASRLIAEERSRNTWENARYSKELLAPAPEERWVLVTSAYHMRRSKGVFDALGWTMIPWPAGYRTMPDGLNFWEFDALRHLREADVALREWLAIAAYRVTGRMSGGTDRTGGG